MHFSLPAAEISSSNLDEPIPIGFFLRENETVTAYFRSDVIHERIYQSGHIARVVLQPFQRFRRQRKMDLSPISLYIYPISHFLSTLFFISRVATHRCM